MAMTIYEPGRFSSTYQNNDGKEIWTFLNSAENLLRMETATYLSRPAAEPLSPFLLQEFGTGIREDRMKQMIGHMIRQALESRGYAIDRSNVRITTQGNMFTSASRYKLVTREG
jgi:hypothetical protein